jgi:hypothetical protein
VSDSASTCSQIKRDHDRTAWREECLVGDGQNYEVEVDDWSEGSRWPQPAQPVEVEDPWNN